MSSSTQSASTSSHHEDLRRFTKIPVFIVENHNDVLEIILPALARRYIPFKNNLLIHFDSHPDMCVPRQMPVEVVFNRSTLLESLSIENWIIPMMYSEHVTEAVWVCPSWAAQIPRGDHDIVVGDSEGKIKVNSNLDYFLSDGCCEEVSMMKNKKTAKIRVVDVGESINEMLREHWILDIDLDYFSTLNPFLNIYPKANTYEKLRKIYQIEKKYDVSDPKSIMEYVKKRNHELDYFEKIFQFMAQNGSLDKFKNQDPSMNEKFELVKELIESLCHHYSIYEVDWFLVNDAGCTCDDEEFQIPHHESSDETIKLMLSRFEEFIKSLKIPPSMVTVARSCDDGYTPSHQVEHIQSEVLRILRNKFAENLHEECLWYKNLSESSALDLIEPRKKIKN